MMEAQSCLHPGGLDFTTRLLAETDLQPGAAILDAGCGDGITVDWLREHGYDAFGIDRKPGQVTSWIQQGALQHLPYGDNQFAAVISECTAFICGDTKAMLEETYRVLKADGWLLLADVYFKEDAKPLPQFADGRPVTLAQWQTLLEDCGFAIQHIEDVSAAWKPFVIEQLWAGRTLEDLWGGCLADGQTSPMQYKPGYLLLWAKKKGANANE